MIAYNCVQKKLLRNSGKRVGLRVQIPLTLQRLLSD